MGSSTLDIRGDRLKERDAAKSLSKVVETLYELFLMISYSYQY